PDARDRAAGELPLALPGPQPRLVLATLARLPEHLDSRLRLHPPGRRSLWADPQGRQRADRVCPVRILAWSQLELPCLGKLQRHRIGSVRDLPQLAGVDGSRPGRAVRALSAGCLGLDSALRRHRHVDLLLPGRAVTAHDAATIWRNRIMKEIHATGFLDRAIT